MAGPKSNMEPDSYIYALRDPETKEIRYVGRSRNPADRLRRHMRDRLRDGTGVSLWLRQLDGKRPECEVIEKCSDAAASDRERYWIAQHRTAHKLVNSEPAGPRRLRKSDHIHIRREGYCKNGHALTPENSRVRPERRNCVECRTCQKAGRKRFNGRKPVYDVWKAMIRRTVDPTFKDWIHYGGKPTPVTVCERWLASYDDFESDVGPRPSSRHTLDRINSESGYQPGNCRWATAKEQSRNMSSNRLVTHCGVTRCLSDWAELSGLSFLCLHYRLLRGATFEEAIKQPVLSLAERGRLQSSGRVRSVEGRFQKAH